MDAARLAVAELLKQIADGADIPPPARLLNMTAERAAIQLPHAPYSILTNLAHANFWQENWLNRLTGVRSRSFVDDWKAPTTTEWPDIRAAFLNGLYRARAIALSEPFDHKMKSDDVAIKTLIKIAVHDAYHLGQINLLKRQLRPSTQESKEALRTSPEGQVD